MSADTALRGNVRLLGNLLGRVLVEQEGERLLELEERIRQPRARRPAGRRGRLGRAVRDRARAAARGAGDDAARVRPLLPAREHRRAAPPDPPPPRLRSARAACSASRWPRRSPAWLCWNLGRRSCGGRPRGSPSSSAGPLTSPSGRRSRPSPRTGGIGRERAAGGGRPTTARSRAVGLRRGRGLARRGDHDPLADRRGARSRRPRVVVDEIRQGLWFVERGLWQAAPRLLAAGPRAAG